MKNSTENYEGLVIYFVEFVKGNRYGPVKLNSLEDLDDVIQKHNNFDEYLVINKSSQGDSTVKMGYIEHNNIKKRRKI